MKRLPMFVLLALAPALACGGGITSDATVADVYFGGLANVVFIRVSPAPAGTPTCSVNAFYNFTIKLGNPGTNQLYAALLSAMMSGKLVSIAGTGACTNSPVVEDLATFMLAQ